MHSAPSDPNPPTHLEHASQPAQHREQDRPGLLSQSDPEPERPTRRPPIWLLIITLLIAAIIVLHLTGVAGAGSH